MVARTPPMSYCCLRKYLTIQIIYCILGNDKHPIFTNKVGSQIIRVNDQSRLIDVISLIQNGHTYLPARYVAEAFGYIVNYDQAQKTVSLTFTGNTSYSSYNTVIIKDNMFNPDVLTIKKGETVMWANNDSYDHTVTGMKSEFVSGPLGSGGTFTHVFNESGAYQYRCNIHTYMTGEIIVQ